ncbi:MAG: isoleucine--tRNA ligase [Chloroflexi bacterium]|nr:isoleucine--tRNA ligase [Chloroflexota bacterium]
MFKPVEAKVDLVQMEADILRFWKARDIFRKTMTEREGYPPYVFYEGPPTANGRPGIHHVLARVFKDLFPRYYTMKGRYVVRKAGWDSHGLPVELEIEKELGFTGKKDIEAYGIAAFNRKCRESVYRYLAEWEQITDRIGYWVDLQDAYVTLSNTYIESVWWILKQMWDKGLLYQGYKVVPYCPRCGTPLSDHEVALGYRDVEDPSVYIKFPLRDEPGTYFLVWTTTPWTLPGNVALAVGKDIEYVLVEAAATEENRASEKLILAKALMETALQGEYRVLKSFKGRDLLNQHYRPLYTFLPVEQNANYVVAGDFVSTGEGTGIVHIAPAFGADDMALAKEHGLPILVTVDSQGKFIDEVYPWRGIFVKDADSRIATDLQNRNLLHRTLPYRHAYPFCWRCGTSLLYYARTTWYLETTRLKDRLVDNNELIKWYPEHVQYGRFGNWLENNVDWALGRERYWGTPLPIWQCASCRHQEAIGSIAELQERSGQSLREDMDLHRPYVDEISFKCPDCRGRMERVPELIDVWFDSGAMPLAQWHYPFENKERFFQQFPADFICEGVDQTRGWFYSLHAIGTLLFDQPSFRNVVCLGLILDAQGEKMSKSRGNVVDPLMVLDGNGADATRWYLFTASPAGQERRFSTELVNEVVRRFLLTLWNTYTFFVTYANMDEWQPHMGDSNARPGVSASHHLDRWILSELHSLIEEVDDKLANYDVTGAARPIEAFVDLLSNWYIRRSRRRFWKSEQDSDKSAAYATLYECLVTVAGLLAPFTPFIAEELYQNLVRTTNPRTPESVHLSWFPRMDPARVDRELMKAMRLAMRMASLGHAARNKASIKVRQPLARAVIRLRSAADRELLEPLASQIADELNVKQLSLVENDQALVRLRLRPVLARLGRRLGELLPQVTAYLAADTGEMAAQLAAGQSVTIRLGRQAIELAPEDVLVDMAPREGFVTADEGGYLVAITTDLTPELVDEGLARELVRRIQGLRKTANFALGDRIITYYQGDVGLQQVMSNFGEYIRSETLSSTLLEGVPVEVAARESIDIDGMRVRLGVKRI